MSARAFHSARLAARRRGFTLLEVALAGVVGAIVLASALALLGTLRRADASIETRAEQVRAFNNAQQAVRRALNTMVVAADTTRTDEGDVQLPRFALIGAGEGQRLELVLSEPLFRFGRPTTSRPSDRDDDEPSGVPRVLTFDDLPTYRGVFRLRLVTRERGGTSAELIWESLEPRALPAGFRFDRSTLPEPVVIATGLQGLEWRAIDFADRVTNYTATFESDVPAYLELELRGERNAMADYLFPLDWTVGPEFDPAGFADDGEGDGSESDTGEDAGDGFGEDEDGLEQAGDAEPLSGGDR